MLIKIWIPVHTKYLYNAYGTNPFLFTMDTPTLRCEQPSSGSDAATFLGARSEQSQRPSLREIITSKIHNY